MDRFSRGWDFIQKSFAILGSNKDLLIFPAASAASCIIASMWILGIFGFAYGDQVRSLFMSNPQHLMMTHEMWAGLFLLYVVNYFIVVFFNVGLVISATDRIAGGHASINQGLDLAWRRKGKIFQWAVVAATFGILMKVAERRLSFLERMGLRLIEMAWGLATVFIAPVLAAEDIGPIDALRRSSQIFKETWGEKLAGGYALGLYFLLLAIPGVVAPFILFRLFGTMGMIAGYALMALYFLLLSTISATVEGVLIAALYRYATTKEASKPFRTGDFATVWRAKA